jgi:catechol 2,3-dioxygenase-like lactoylglutathione lyase family enzyme
VQRGSRRDGRRRPRRLGRPEAAAARLSAEPLSDLSQLQRVGVITLFVGDLERAKAFYGRTFELTPVFEDAESAAFRYENMLVNLLVDRAASELIEPAPVAAAGAARFMLTVWVDDVDALVGELRGRGVELLNGPQDRPWGVRTAAFADPDGHVWELAQRLGEHAA